jgi:hypothetical protein
MTVHDLTSQYYRNVPAIAPVGSSKWIHRRFTGTDLKAVVKGTGATPVDGDSFKWAEIGVGQLVREVGTIVVAADGDSLTLDIGSMYASTLAATTFETDANLHATGVTISSDDIFYFPVKGWLTLTPSSLTNLDAATEIIVCANVIDLYDVGITATLTAPI